MMDSSDITTQIAYDCATNDDFLKAYNIRHMKKDEQVSDKEIDQKAKLTRTLFGAINGKSRKPSSKN